MPEYFKKARDPISSYTHVLGAIFSVFGTLLMLIKWAFFTDRETVLLGAVLAYGFSLIALYLASGVYHYSNAPLKHVAILRKLDHSMIYVLIAGTYTPLLLKYFAPVKGIIFTAAMWAAALLGCIMKVCWMKAPRWLSTVLYIAMGWVIIVDLPSLSAMPIPGIALLMGGGVAYTAGAVIYAVKKPNLPKGFGFHEIFHLFVLLGSLLHFIMVFCFVL